MKKFDFAIGNPPYQEEVKGNNKDKPIYNYFYDEAEKIAVRYELITPGRFLFNAGLTPTEWNKKMLSDDHFNVLFYSPDGKTIFPGTDIKGGVVIGYRDSTKTFGAIDEFIVDDNMRSIIKKLRDKDYRSITSDMFGGRAALKLNDLFFETFPNYLQDRIDDIQKKNPSLTGLRVGEESELRNKVFEYAPYIFEQEVSESKKDEYYHVLGLFNNKRVYRWIQKRFLTIRYPDNNNICNYKVFISKASGTGSFGEKLSEPVIGYPDEFSTPTFISVGILNSAAEAKNLTSYLKTKFVRSLLSVLKITQDIVPSKFKYVPLQDFTSSSDIDWSKSVADIDRQLYAKYGLSNEEIDFIESHVQEMK